MKVRAAILAVLMAGTLAWCQHATSRGAFREAEQLFLDFLVAQPGEPFTRQLPEKSDNVVLVEFREADKAEYSAWPPAPLDYILALKRLASQEPEVLAFTMPLHWDTDQSQFTAELRDKLLAVPSVVLPYRLSNDPEKATPDEKEFFAERLPDLRQHTHGSHVPALHFQAARDLPDKVLRTVAQMGFVPAAPEADPDLEPLIASDGQRMTPSLAAQALTLFRRIPYAAQRWRFENGGRLSLGDRYIVPLEKAGSVKLRPRPEVPRIDALALMTPDLGDEADKALRETLGRHKCVVFTLSPDASGERQAKAIALGLAMPEVHQAGAIVSWCWAAGACLLGFWQLHYRRLGALIFGLAVTAAGLMSNLLVFSTALTWWPPFLPLAVSATATVFCVLFPNRAKIATVSTADER